MDALPSYRARDRANASGRGAFALAMAAASLGGVGCGGSSGGSAVPDAGGAGSGAGAVDAASANPLDGTTSLGDDAGPPNEDGGSGCDVFLHAFCTLLDACEPVPFHRNWYGTVAKCMAQLSSTCAAELAAPGTSATEQTMAMCAQQMAQESCDGFLTGSPAACLLPGSVPNAAPCEFPSQCESTYCNVTAFCGTCEPRVGTGGACSPVGDPRYVACQPGLICTYSGTSSVCSVPIGQGGACDTAVSNQCAPPLTCLQGQCSPPLSVDAGQCNLDTDCTGDAYCSTAFHDSVCRMLAYQPVGATCNPPGGEPCGAGANCLAVDAGAAAAACVAVAANGGPCSTYSDCLAPAQCTKGACQTVVPASSCQ